MSYKISLESIESVFKARSWWDMLFNLKIAKFITYFIATRTSLTPNQVTVVSFIFATLAGVSFWYENYILGAVLYQISYIFDIVDGALARVKNLTSKFGAFFDVFTDWFKAPILIVIVLYFQDSLIFLITILLLLFWNASVNRYNDMLFFTTKSSLRDSSEIKLSKVGRYFQFMESKKLIPFPATVEFEAVVLFLYPIFRLDIFLYLAVAILIFNFLLKIYAIMKKLK